MKKAISILLILCMAVGTLTGCLGGSTGETKAPQTKSNETTAKSDETPAAGDETAAPGTAAADQEAIDYNAEFELRFTGPLTGEDRTALLDEAIAILNEKWPNVTVVNECTSDYAQKLKLEFGSGAGYDMAYLDDLNQQTLQKNNYLMDITDDVIARGWLDQAIEGAVEFNNLRTPGQYYSVPFLMAPIMIYYNKDIFAELGVEVPKTVDELEAIMQKAKDAGYIPTECGGDNYYQMGWAAESMILNTAPKEDIDDWYYQINSSDAVKNAFIDTFTRLKKWYDNGWYRADFEGVKGDDVISLFSQGKTALTLDGDWSLSQFEMSGLNVGAFAFPGFEAGTPYAVNAVDGAWALNINLDANKKACALDFIDVFYQPEYLAKWYEKGYTPAVKADMSSVEATELHKEVVAASADTKLGFYLDNVKPGFLDLLVKNMQLLTQGENTPETLWDALDAEWQNK